MADGTIQVAPNSTGALLHTRTRTVASSTVHEQYVHPIGDRIVTAGATVASFTIPARAATTQNLVTGLNNGSATNVIAIRRIAVEVDSIVAKTVASPWLRLMRITAHTGGNTLTPVPLDQSQTLNATGLALLQDASADRTSSTTALSSTLATGVNANIIWQQVVPRWQTLAGYQALPSLPMLPDDGGFLNDNPFLLRAGQGFLVRFDVAAALTAGDFTFGVKVAFEEFTNP